MTNKNRGKKLSVRLTEEEQELFQILAEKNGVKDLSKFVRNAVISYAERGLEEEEILNKIDPEDRQKAKDTLFNYIDSKFTPLERTLVEMNNNLQDKLNWHEKMLNLIMYMFLYHTPEVPPELKEAFALSAKSRKKKFLDALQDKDLP